ncbi:MAG: RIP metalloprotease RseP [Alphaproteobacteria bacterium]|nr:RIP metalloprotease RseP [Alphaproteobacteria bacterium]
MVPGWDVLGDEVMAIVVFPFCVFLIFTLHEMGHYVVARLCGVRVKAFHIGLGPRLWGCTDKHGTAWAVHLLPVCGLVELAGQVHAVEERDETPDMFCAQPLWQRALIILAGPTTNLVLAFLFFAGFFIFGGIPGMRTDIVGIEIGSPAQQAGLQPGDVITAIDGKEVRRGEQVQRIITRHIGTDLSFTMARGDQVFDVTMAPYSTPCINARGFDCARGQLGTLLMARPLIVDAISHVDGIESAGDTDKTYELLRARAGQDVIVRVDSLGGDQREFRVVPDAEYLRDKRDSVSFRMGAGGFYDPLSLGEALREAARETGRLVAGTAYVAIQMWPVDRERFAPEIMIPREQDAVRHDFYKVLYIGGLMSVFVAFFNMLPLPRLDGGALLLLAIEKAVGPRKVHTVAPYIVRSVILLFFVVLAFAHAGDFMSYVDLLSTKGE